MAVVILTGSDKTADIREIFFRGKSWTWSEDKSAFITKVWIKTKAPLNVEGHEGEFWEQTLGTLSKEDRTLIMGMLKFAVDVEYGSHKTVTYKAMPDTTLAAKNKDIKGALAWKHLAIDVTEAVEDMSMFKNTLVKSVMLPSAFIGNKGPGK